MVSVKCEGATRRPKSRITFLLGLCIATDGDGPRTDSFLSASSHPVAPVVGNCGNSSPFICTRASTSPEARVAATSSPTNSSNCRSFCWHATCPGFKRKPASAHCHMIRPTNQPSAIPHQPKSQTTFVPCSKANLATRYLFSRTATTPIRCHVCVRLPSRSAASA